MSSWSMFICLVCLLVLRLWPHLTAADSWQCTASCTCYSGNADDQTIQCYMPTGNVTVTEQVTRYLEHLYVSSTLRSLKILAHLSTIPEPICRMSSLSNLYLIDSHIVRIQDNCLNRLSNLVTFELSSGRLIELQDGLFDGLRNLQELTLSQNNIIQIGTRLFAEESGLDSLLSIQLDVNNLQTLDAWIFYRVRVVNSVKISINENQIERFTNDIGWQYNCKDLNLHHAQITLLGSKVRHLNDIIRGWGLNWTECDTTSIELWIPNEYQLCDCIDYDYRMAFPKSRRQWLFKGVRSCPTNILCDGCPTGCDCSYNDIVHAIDVDCTSARLTALPSNLPPLKPDSQYVIDFSNNANLTTLSNSEYFDKTRSFIVSNSGVDTIEDAVVRQLFQVISAVDLSGNRLKSLPKVASSVRPLANLTRIDLTNNPWDCSCSNGWMIGWLNSMKDNLVNDEQILCDSPPSTNNKQLLRLTVNDLCDNPASKAMILAIAVSLSVFAVVVVSFLVVWRIRFRLFVTLHIHPFDRDECEGEEMEYDVFFSCCDDDEDEYGNFILNRLEKEGYKVCFHARDFHGGRTNFENMTVAIQHSKRTVCLITENFLRDTYCCYEFEQAFDHYLLKLGKRRLIALVRLDDPTSTVNTLGSETMREFIRRYTYIEYNQHSEDSVWLNRLLYALPVKGMQQQQQHDEEEGQIENPGNEVDDDDRPLLP